MTFNGMLHNEGGVAVIQQFREWLAEAEDRKPEDIMTPDELTAANVVRFLTAFVSTSRSRSDIKNVYNVLRFEQRSNAYSPVHDAPGAYNTIMAEFARKHNIVLEDDTTEATTDTAQVKNNVPAADYGNTREFSAGVDADDESESENGGNGDSDASVGEETKANESSATSDLCDRLEALNTHTAPRVIESGNNLSKPDPINCFATFKSQIKSICDDIVGSLGRYQCEMAYQKALVHDLKLRGVGVETKLVIPFKYDGEEISSRSADLAVVFRDGEEQVVIELKATKKLSSEHRTQLEFYMFHFDIEHGFLINFPKLSTFAKVNATFSSETLSGTDVPPRKDKESILNAHIVYLRRNGEQNNAKALC